MNHTRRRKKRASHGVRSVELARGKNGFGFTISGQAPCIFSCIVAGSPAERAGLRPGDFLVAANGVNISRLPHDDVVRLIGNSTGLLHLQIAENYYSDSSSDEEPVTKPKHSGRTRHRREHVYRAEKVVRDLWTGALFVERAEEVEPTDCGSAERRKNHKDPILRAVVGYLGTVEMPAFRLGAVGNCIRRLRIEKKVHTLVLLSVYADGILLTDPRGHALATFPADRISFSGAYVDDRKFFGLVTTSCGSRSGSVGCHVFLVDPKLKQHRAHARQAKAFRLACSNLQRHNQQEGECREFPDSADVVLKAVAGLYGNHLDSLVSPPQPSNTSSNSSNSDSGIGFRDEGNNSDRVVIVETYHRLRTNSLDRQSHSLQSSNGGKVDRLTCRTMPERPVPDKLSPKVFPLRPLRGASTDRVDQVAKKWSRTASLRRHLPGRKRSVRKTSSASDMAGTVSDGELPDAIGSVTGCERGVDVGRVCGWASRFDCLLEDPAGLHAFTEFLKQEFSQENISFWTACEQYRKLTDTRQMSRTAEDIFARHLCAGAPEPVNVDSQARQVAQEGLEHTTDQIFLPAQKQIFNLMKFDCYQRFLKSRLFKGCLLREMQGLPLLGEVLPARKSILPWSKSGSKLPKRSSKKKKKRREESDGSDSSVRIGSVEVPPSLCLSTKEAMHNQNIFLQKSLAGTELGSLCRAVMPDSSMAMLRLRSGETVGEMLRGLLQRRGLPCMAVDAFLPNSRKPVDLRQDASELSCGELRLERRILFRLYLMAVPGMACGVKAVPERSCREVLRPILLHFGLRLEELLARPFPPCTRPFDMDQIVTTLDARTLALYTESQAFQYVDDGMTEKLFGQLAEGVAHLKLGDTAVVCLQQMDKNVPEKRDDSDELLDMWKRAQRSRLDDQRGTEIDFELPDFLKITGKENRPASLGRTARPPPPLPPKSNARGPPPRPPSRQPFCISFV